MHAQSGHVVQPSLLMSGAGSPRGKQHLRELLEEYDQILAGRIDSLKPLSNTESALRENIEFENSVYKKKTEEERQMKALQKSSKEGVKVALPSEYRKYGKFDEVDSDDEDAADETDTGGAKKTKMEFYNAGQQVRRMFRAVRLFERKKKMDKMERLERKGTLAKIRQDMGNSFGNMTELLENLEISSDDGSVFSASGLRSQLAGGDGTSTEGGNETAEDILGATFGISYDDWTDEEVLEHLNGKIDQEKVRNEELKNKLLEDLQGYINAERHAHLLKNSPTGKKKSFLGGPKKGSISPERDPSALSERSGSSSNEINFDNLPPHKLVLHMKSSLESMVEKWCEWCKIHAQQEATEAERLRNAFRDFHVNPAGSRSSGFGGAQTPETKKPTAGGGNTTGRSGFVADPDSPSQRPQTGGAALVSDGLLPDQSFHLTAVDSLVPDTLRLPSTTTLHAPASGRAQRTVSGDSGRSVGGASSGGQQSSTSRAHSPLSTGGGTSSNLKVPQQTFLHHQKSLSSGGGAHGGSAPSPENASSSSKQSGIVQFQGNNNNNKLERSSTSNSLSTVDARRGGPVSLAGGSVSAARYGCMQQIAVEQRKSMALRAAIVDCDVELKKKHLMHMLSVPKQLVPRLVPPSLVGSGHDGDNLSALSLQNPKLASQLQEKLRRGLLTEAQVVKLLREEQRQHALKMSFQLSATVSDIIHCVNITTDIVHDEKVTAGLQKEVRQRMDALEFLIDMRHMADRAKAWNVDLK